MLSKDASSRSARAVVDPQVADVEKLGDDLAGGEVALESGETEAQNAQAMAQPTCVEMQMVSRECSSPTPSCRQRG
jgi:hypothetical protein